MGTRVFSIIPRDGGGLAGTAATSTISIGAVNSAPVQSAIEGTNVAYTENDPAIQITNAISISDVDDTNIESAVVAITGNFATGEDW